MQEYRRTIAVKKEVKARKQVCQNIDYIKYTSSLRFLGRIPLFPSISSATILVAARLIPEFAKVVAKVKIDMISSKTPCSFTTKLVCNVNAKEHIYGAHK
ncbi:MAG: hypothetical protein K2H53_06955 [Clostridia bacterium]|nr:hypothetical protein [Clostridia bacterium]